MLFRTPRFIAFGLPSSYSIPAAPPSPDIFSNRSRSSASDWATDLDLLEELFTGLEVSFDPPFFCLELFGMMSFGGASEEAEDKVRMIV